MIWLTLAAALLAVACVGQLAHGAFDPILVTSTQKAVETLLQHDRELSNTYDLANGQHHDTTASQLYLKMNGAGRECMYRQWTCGTCSGISESTLRDINSKRCSVGDDEVLIWCNGLQVSIDLVKAVHAGDCRWTCSETQPVFRCSEGLQETTGSFLMCTTDGQS